MVTKTSNLLKSMKQQNMKVTPIGTEIILPNHSGIHHNLKADNTTSQDTTTNTIHFPTALIGEGEVGELNILSTYNYFSGGILLADGKTITSAGDTISFDNENLTTTGKGTFGSTYQAILGYDSQSKAGYFDDGVTNLDLANGIYGISVNGGSQTAGYFYDVTGNVVALADNTYAINATGNVIINSGTLTIGSTTLTEQNLIDLLALL